MLNTSHSGYGDSTHLHAQPREGSSGQVIDLNRWLESEHQRLQDERERRELWADVRFAGLAMLAVLVGLWALAAGVVWLFR